MGFLRSLGKFVLGSVFSLSLVLLLVASSFSQLTEYSSLKKVFSGITETQMKKINISEAYYLMKNVCKIEKKINLPIDNETIELNCSEIEKIEEKDFQDFLTTKVFEKFYFKEYPCSIIECLKKGDVQNFLIIFSNEGNLFFKKIQNYLIFITAATCIGFILVLKSFEEKMKGLGKVLFSTGLFYFIFKFSYSFLPTQIKEFKIVEETFNIFTEKFLYLFIAGILLIIFGYLISYRKRKKTK
jgi:hypothetical protein